MNTYPSFVPPGGIGTRQPDDWSSAEAKQYFGWMLGCIDERTSSLIEYFGEHLSAGPEVLLMRLGDKVSQALQSPPFAEPEADTPLSNTGFALAADMGLLVARLLLADRNVGASWVLIKAKGSIHYNQPVLRGSNKGAFNPVFGSVTDVAYSLKNKLRIDADRWLKSYLHWKDLFSSSKPAQA